MRRYIYLGCMFLLISMVQGCGNQGSPGNGNTEFVTISAKQGTSSVVFANVSGSNSGLYSANNLSYTITGHVYQGSTTKIPASDIEFRSISYAYAAVNSASCVSPVFSPAFITMNTSHRLPSGDGSTLDIENIPVFFSTDLVQIFNSVPAGTRLCQYDVTLTFNGTESNTGTAISKSVTTSAFVSIKK